MKMYLIAGAALLATQSAPVRGPRAISAAIAANGQVVLPMQVKSGFAFVEGAVNGRRGYFMLDTGTPYSVFLNSAFLRLPPGRPLASGSASSGQKINVFRYDCLRSLRIAASYTLDGRCDLPGANLGFVAAELKLPFLGFLGDGLFKPYRVTFDWRARRATLDDRTRPIEGGAVTTFRFGPADKQVPHFTLRAGTVSISGGMDTGDPGHVTLTKADAKTLLGSGRLTITREEDGATHYVLPAVEHEGGTVDTSALPVSIAGDRSDIMLGFLVLRTYRSIWDYQDGTVRFYR